MDVLMPQLGETVAEGKITKWFKATGDAVKPGDNLFEIETDKVSMEVPAIVVGTLREIRVSEGEVAPVGAVVAVIAAEGGDASVRSAPAVQLPLPVGERVGVRGDKSLDQPATPSPPPFPLRGAGVRPVPAAQSRLSPSVPLDPFFEVRTPERNYGPARLPGGAYVTPLARRLASEGGIDLNRVKASGPHARIVRHAQDHCRAADARQADHSAFLSQRRCRYRAPACPA
jgi:pyruvate/2-oxoglutarate dehydrogenase complex dihydrolipoamide acyltransferase (E2) component